LHFKSILKYFMYLKFMLKFFEVNFRHFGCVRSSIYSSFITLFGKKCHKTRVYFRKFNFLKRVIRNRNVKKFLNPTPILLTLNFQIYSSILNLQIF